MIKYVPPPVEGAPPYVVWCVGLGFILMALALIGSVVYMAIFVYRDAQTRRTWPVMWLVIALIGGWLGAGVWFVVRERYPDLILEQITANEAKPVEP
jgi:hypothetical protein